MFPTKNFTLGYFNTATAASENQRKLLPPDPDKDDEPDNDAQLDTEEDATKFSKYEDRTEKGEGIVL